MLDWGKVRNRCRCRQQSRRVSDVFEAECKGSDCMLDIVQLECESMLASGVPFMCWKDAAFHSDRCLLRLVSQSTSAVETDLKHTSQSIGEWGSRCKHNMEKPIKDNRWCKIDTISV